MIQGSRPYVYGIGGRVVERCRRGTCVAPDDPAGQRQAEGARRTTCARAAWSGKPEDKFMHFGSRALSRSFRARHVAARGGCLARHAERQVPGETIGIGSAGSRPRAVTPSYRLHHRERALVVDQCGISLPCCAGARQLATPLLHACSAINSERAEPMDRRSSMHLLSLTPAVLSPPSPRAIRIHVAGVQKWLLIFP